MEDERSLLRELFAAAIRAVNPGELVSSRLRRDGTALTITGISASWTGPTVVVGAGKAAACMADAAAKAIASDLVGGVVIGPHGAVPHIPGIVYLQGGHPLPDSSGERATRQLIKVLEAHPQAAVVALVSGGASSLLVQPTPPLSLADKIATNSVLLASGAAIHEVNTVRKHLSRVKGGGLVRITRGRPLTALLMSDVLDDAPETIGSGPTAPDPTTFAEALDVLQRYRVLQEMPPAAVTLLRSGAGGGLPETLKPGAPETQGVTNVVVGSNRLALEAAASAARQAGCRAIVKPELLAGDTGTAAKDWVNWVLRLGEEARGPLCLVAGGETTVRLEGKAGKGGRNQEFALVCAQLLADRNIHLLSAGTDGIDGPTDAAGAFVDGSSFQRAGKRGFDPAGMLAKHDSYCFFDVLGDLFRPGPTGTNVMDIKIALVGCLRNP